MPSTLISTPVTPARETSRTALDALNAIKRAPRPSILRSIRAGKWYTVQEIEDLIGFSAEEALLHLTVLEDLGVLLHDEGHFSLDTGALHSLLLEAKTITK